MPYAAQHRLRLPRKRRAISRNHFVIQRRSYDAALYALTPKGITAKEPLERP